MPTRVSVRDVREHLGLSQADFGQLFPVAVRTVRRWERGEAAPSPMAVERLQKLQEKPAGPTRRSRVE